MVLHYNKVDRQKPEIKYIVKFLAECGLPAMFDSL